MRALSLLSVLICNGWLSLMVGNRIDAASAGASLKTSKRDGKVTEVIVIDAEFDRQYLSAVSNANETVYLFSIEPHHPEQVWHSPAYSISKDRQTDRYFSDIKKSYTTGVDVCFIPPGQFTSSPWLLTSTPVDLYYRLKCLVHYLLYGYIQ